MVQWVYAAPLYSQLSVSQREDSTITDEGTQFIRHIRFTGNESVSSSTLEQLIRTKTNRRLFGIDYMTPWVFIYKITSTRFGEAPSIYDPDVAQSDIERIILYYESIGFFEANVSLEIQKTRHNRVRVVFSIQEGPQAIIHSLSYSGFPSEIPSAQLKDFIRKGLPNTGLKDDSTLILNRNYYLQELREEQDRVLDFLKNNGYASVTRDSIMVLVKEDSLSPYLFEVRYRIRAGKPFQFGEIEIELKSPERTSNGSENDSGLNSGSVRFTDVLHKGISFEMDSAALVDPTVIVNSIHMKPGDLFNQKNLQNSIAELQSLDMIRVNRFGLLDPISGSNDTLYLPVFFDLQALPRHSLRLELFGMERYGYGSGVGFIYTNNNAFRRAESFRFQLNSSFEFVSSSTLGQVINDPEKNNTSISSESAIFQSYDASLQYTVPGLNWPFSLFDQQSLFRNAVTRYSLLFTRANQLYFNINSDIRFNTRFEVHHTSQRSSYLDFFELSVVDTDPSPEFEESLNLQFPDDTLQIIRIKEDFRPQINSLIRYTHRNIDTDLIKRDRGHFSEYSLTIGGNAPYLIDRFFVTPDKVEGNLPSPFKISSNALDYNQFVKITADYRRYSNFSKDWVFAWRVFGGFAQPFSINQSVPLNQRFFAGGSNDIRAWAPFRLGPGIIPPEKVTINGGEIKLAAFAELRTLAFENTLSGNWHTAFFVDAGNTWYGPSNQLRNDRNSNLLKDGTFFVDSFYKQIAVSSGIGIRIDWEFVVARVDFAFRIHDLQEGWLNNRKMYFNFGIGHSF